MLNFIGNICRLSAAIMLISGAIVASQQYPLTASDVLLLGVGLAIFGDLLKGIGVTFEHNSKEKAAVSRPD